MCKYRKQAVHQTQTKKSKFFRGSLLKKKLAACTLSKLSSAHGLGDPGSLIFFLQRTKKEEKKWVKAEKSSAGRRERMACPCTHAALRGHHSFAVGPVIQVVATAFVR